MLRYDVYGYRVGVRRVGDEWTAVYLGDEGRHRPADGVVIPPWTDPSEIARILADIFHEAATQERPDVVFLGEDRPEAE